MKLYTAKHQKTTRKTNIDTHKPILLMWDRGRRKLKIKSRFRLEDHFFFLFHLELASNRKSEGDGKP